MSKVLIISEVCVQMKNVSLCSQRFSLIIFAYFSVLFRVDADCISPDVKNSIHVGDRILEINGTPIHNVPLDEVITTPLHCN